MKKGQFWPEGSGKRKKKKKKEIGLELFPG
jgi:hypothetical protein